MTVIPRATYRLQFRNGMTFEEAGALAPYLRRLGVSHLYASPISTATPGSTHGYDVADFNELDPAIGGETGFNAFTAALKAEGLKLLVDFVPNHMGATTFNAWWRNVLEWGAASDFRDVFDIDWTAPKLLVPALGEPYGKVLMDGGFALAFDRADGGMALSYSSLSLPLTPPSYALLLTRMEGEPFDTMARRFTLSTPETGDALKAELAEAAKDEATAAAIEAAVEAVAADTDALHALHEAQAWRLAYWRAARETLTYRRFFEIADLVGVKVERPRVFDDVHKLLLRLVGEGRIDGIRLDHIDGLADPKGYLVKLQGAIGGETPFYLVVEKILGPHEELPADWPVAGTTGYEFIAALASVFVDGGREEAMTRAYETFAGHPVNYLQMVVETKRRILTRNLAGELAVLTEQARALSTADPMTRDFGADTLRRAILEVAAALPVYRAYVNVEGPSEQDRKLVSEAVAAAKSAREVEDEAAIDFVGRMLTLDFARPEEQGAALAFTVRFQQTTGPVMAKALEDTVFYRYNRLVALNEVGGDPDRYGGSRQAFHKAMQGRLERQAHGLSATATHDTKRGEDARARLYALSEMPRAWGRAAQHWSTLNEAHRGGGDNDPSPEPEMEWLFYQALAGAWPAGLALNDRDGLKALSERMEAYMLKAVKEAKVRTSWAAANPAYEEALGVFVRKALDPRLSRRFLSDFLATAEPIHVAGALNGLAQLALKLALPGVPDIYQGTELWDFSLVDPDNRRPVDFEALGRMLDSLDGRTPDDLVADWRSGAIKMRLMRAGLSLREERPALFAEGAYLPLEVEGEGARHLLAFARERDGEAVVAAAPRLALDLLEDADRPLVPPERWGETAIVLPERLGALAFRDAVTGERVEPGERILARDLLARFPVALVASEG